MFSEPDWSLNWKSYRFMVHWSNRRLNHSRTSDIIMYIIKIKNNFKNKNDKLLVIQYFQNFI